MISRFMSVSFLCSVFAFLFPVFFNYFCLFGISETPKNVSTTRFSPQTYEKTRFFRIGSFWCRWWDLNPRANINKMAYSSHFSEVVSSFVSHFRSYLFYDSFRRFDQRHLRKRRWCPRTGDVRLKRAERYAESVSEILLRHSGRVCKLSEAEAE